MRIRTQLILAAFVLAVIPLAAIVTYSYHSSRKALESTYRHEAERLTKQMDRRLASIRAELAQRIEFVSALPMTATAPGADAGTIVTVMGDSASIVEALDFEPVRVAAKMPDAGSTQEKEVPPAPAAPPALPEEAEPKPTIAAVAPPALPTPVVIDIPSQQSFPRYVVSEEQKELIEEIGRLGRELSSEGLSADERADLVAEMRSTQSTLNRVVQSDRERFQARMNEARAAARLHRELMQSKETENTVSEAVKASMLGHVPHPAENSAPSAAQQPTHTTAPRVEVRVHGATRKDLQEAARTAERAALILGRKFRAPVRQEGEVVGQISARVSPEQVIRRILGSAAEDRSEIPFAVDRQGTLYTRDADERGRLQRLGIVDQLRRRQNVKGLDGWIVSTSTDPQSGLRIGVARPVGDNLEELRRAAARNFGLGAGLIALALIGIVPLSNHLTRDVKRVTEGAERIAHGDLETRLPVKTNNELGQLARAFNQMAEDLSTQRQQLVEQERTRREQELQQRLLAVEYERKSIELEDARRFQLSMLPKELPQHDRFDVSVFTRTATEVGGDYYDFHLASDVLSVTIGDATGHGAKAGTMVTVVKTLFAGYAGNHSPSAFLSDAADRIKRMDLGRMAMALALARFERSTLTLASAGMPPALVHRAAAQSVEEIALSATPLGTFGNDYPEQTIDLQRGDTVLFWSDGFPELMNEAGQQLGYAAAIEAFASAARENTASSVIAALAGYARQWHGDTPPNDDVTFVVVRVV